jgi:ATP-dependent DNA helicase RecG
MTLSDQIVELLLDNNKLSQQEIANKLGISFYTVKEYITKLKKGGILERVGADRGGYWRMIK